MEKSIHSAKYEQLISALKKARRDKGLTMRELGDRLEITHSFVGRVEQMERRLDVFEYVQYCEALGIDPAKYLKLLKTNNIKTP